MAAILRRNPAVIFDMPLVHLPYCEALLRALHDAQDELIERDAVAPCVASQTRPSPLPHLMSASRSRQDKGRPSHQARAGRPALARSF